MNRKHLIFDFETFGQNTQTCPIIDCSFLIVDEYAMKRGDYTFDGLIDQAVKFKVSVEEQVKQYGYKVEKQTVEWWERQGDDARKQILPKPDDLSLKEFCEAVINFIDDNGRVDYWWARANTFDPIILFRAFKDCGMADEMDKRLKFWKVRDTRSYIEGAFGFDFDNKFLPDKDCEEKFVAHDSRHDIAVDLLRLQTILKEDEFDDEIPF